MTWYQQCKKRKKCSVQLVLFVRRQVHIFTQKKSIQLSGFNFTLRWPGWIKSHEDPGMLLNSPAGALLSRALMFLHPNAASPQIQTGVTTNSFLIHWGRQNAWLFKTNNDFQEDSGRLGSMDQCAFKQNTLALHPQLSFTIQHSCE